MNKNRILLLIAIVCMAIGMKAQENTEVTTSVMLDSAVIKKEATENYEKGNKYWKAKEWDKALTYYNMAAEGGNAEAQYLLGLLCIEGKRMLQDYNKAIEWLEKAGLQGHKDAQRNLASIFYQGKIVPKDIEMAEFWAKKYKDLPE
ncbi:MAG: sel1 repeat family protein [Bacteroidaceae bacterium]|nr:sel1 repeat family protein [Bacteroidaceae bacterium]